LGAFPPGDVTSHERKGVGVHTEFNQATRPGQRFGMTAASGGFDDANAIGFSAAGVVARDLLRVGAGVNEGMIAGRAGVSFGGVVEILAKLSYANAEEVHLRRVTPLVPSRCFSNQLTVAAIARRPK
jgi:hypothetical protein